MWWDLYISFAFQLQSLQSELQFKRCRDEWIKSKLQSSEQANKLAVPTVPTSGNDVGASERETVIVSLKSLNDSIRLVVNKGHLDSATAAQILFSRDLKGGSDEAGMVWGIVA